jgi:hypothetical protein
MKTKTLFALLLILSFMTACAQATPTGSYPPPGSGAGTPTSVPPSPTEMPTEVVSTPTTVPTQLTAAQQAAIQAVSQKYNIPADQIKITSTEPMTWNNGCMGVVLPGVLCTDVIVNGFIVKLEANGQQFEMHTNQDGTSVIDAAQLQATLSFVIREVDQTIQVVSPNIPLGLTYNPAFTGLPSLGGPYAGTAYLIDSLKSDVVAVSATSRQILTFIQNPTYALAIWRGGESAQPMLAWGTQPAGDDRATSLMIANLDGSSLQTLLTISPNTQTPVQLLAEFWSADGKSLYFSKEPVGIGGYIPFSGISNLYKIDIASKQVTDIIPQPAEVTQNPCLDAISQDYRFVADHCQQGVITVRDLQTGSTATIQPPADFSGYRLIGTARFSPTGDRVAFALAKGNPDGEQGWLAVGSSSGGTVKIIATSDAANYYNVVGWLDDQTLVAQEFSLGTTSSVNQVLTVSVDGSVITKVAEGILLTIIDNR